MQVWKKYKEAVNANILDGLDHQVMGLSYWRNRLFAKMLVYLIPVSLVALVPGIIMSFKSNIPLLAVVDVLISLVFVAIAANRSLSLPLRKILVIICLYFLSIMLLVYLGSLGPGLLYLLSLTVFITLIFSIYIAWLSVAINTVIVILAAILIHFQLFGSPLTKVYTIGSWIAVSSNLLFLSSVIVASLHLLFNGLEATIVKANELQKQLREERNSLAKALNAMEIKNHELEQFAYIASHDLQEPLRTIANIVGLLEEEYGERLDEEGRQYLVFLSQSSTRMRELITALLEYARIGKEMAMQQLNCNQILQEVIADLSVQMSESNAEVITGNLPSLPAFRIELKLLFQNLISNAIKFRKANSHPQIEIAATEKPDHWRFEVKDNGIGIEEKFRQKIFMIFQRVHPKSKYDGLGIGLSHCKKIVELHGGKIWVESEEAEGSTFYFTLAKTSSSDGN